MSTKINTTYYGAEADWTTVSSWGSSAKRADGNHTFFKLAQNGDLDLENDANIDFSCVPWGIPRCSISSCAYPLFLSSGAISDFNGYFYPINENLDTTNNALVLVSGGGSSFSWESGQSASTARSYQKRRVIGETKISGSNLVSTLTADDGTTIQSGANYNESVLTYLDYQKTKVIIDSVYLIDVESVASTVSSGSNLKIIDFWDLPNQELTDNWRCIGFSCKLITDNNLGSDGTFHATFANKHKTPKHIKNTLGGGTFENWVQFHRNCIETIGRTSGYNANGTALKLEDVNAISSTSSYVCSPLLTAYNNVSEQQHNFEDVSYNWIQAARYASGSIVVWHTKNDPIVNASLKFYTLLKTENDTVDEIIKAILHEVAFLGFPFIIDEQYVLENIGDSHVYLPEFDEHMITTGKYKKGSAAAALDNATWGNIFDTTMPVYDPNYIPPEPEPGEDTGDLDNQKLHNLRYDGSNNYYLLTESELSQFIGFINGLYTGESDPEKQRSIDFMGSNPTDYIVGIYGCGIELTGGATTSIKLGAVDTSDAGIFGRAVSTNLTYVNFGNYDIPAYGNFLDFKPYTTIEVYVPLCGTIEVDPGEYIGHNLKVDGLIDYQTGELTARIVRDGKTVTNTLTGSMWVQLPVTAAKMGDYQNNQHQLRMQMLSSVLSFGQSSANAINSDVQSAAGAIAGSAAGGSPTALATPGKAQFTIPQNAVNTALALYNTHYQITHTQPARATASSASAGNALEMYHHAMIFIKRPTFLEDYDRETYAHTIGHACCITAKLSSFSGYTVFSAANLDNISTKSTTYPLQATAQEKQLLKQALQAGIYINEISPE